MSIIGSHMVKKIKVALVHDYIKEYGGAERVLEAFHEIFPEAPVYTSLYMPSFLGPHSKRFKDWDIRTSFLQNIFLKGKLISLFRLFSPFVFRNFDLSDFDVVIVSATGAYFPNFIKKGRGFKNTTVHVCYCHTPPRYLYGYATARNWKKHRLFAFFGTIANHLLRMVDYKASERVDYYIANSREVAGRIRKFYRRDSIVIYPPVDCGLNFKKGKKESYFLTGGRLARAKRIDLIIEACVQLGVPLKIFGRGFAGYEEELRSLAKSGVEFLGEVNDEEKFKLMSKAKAFIFAGEDEDFGIIPVESMICGTPVIAYKSGGLKETVIEGKTGLFFENLSVESLIDTLRKFDKFNLGMNMHKEYVSKFSKKRFKEEIKKLIEEVIRDKSRC